jgi:hypothetical protein
MELTVNIKGWKKLTFFVDSHFCCAMLGTSNTDDHDKNEGETMKLSEFLNRFNLKEELIISYSGADALKAVEHNGYALRYVKEQTPEICMRAVESHGNALRYVKDQTPEICMKAVERNGYALQYVNPAVFDSEEDEGQATTEYDHFGQVRGGKQIGVNARVTLFSEEDE